MNSNGDVAEQVVRLSLEGMEVTAKLTGTAAKHLAVLLFSILKQEQKTRGKARLTSMIKSGKELKVFAVPQKDLATFVEHAKQYGVLYCVLKDKNNTAPDAVVDIISRAEDAAKIQRIFDRFGIGKVEQASITKEMDIEEQTIHTEEKTNTPFMESTDKETPSGKKSMNENMQDKKSSVKEKLNRAKSKAKQKTPLEFAKEVPHHEAVGR
ncbi:MAG: PcfB family protein [Lachnospiraceae bacterium]